MIQLIRSSTEGSCELNFEYSFKYPNNHIWVRIEPARASNNWFKFKFKLERTFKMI